MRGYLQPIALAVLLSLVLLGCQGRSPQTFDIAATEEAGQAGKPPPRCVAMEALVADITAEPVPAGVDAGVYTQLKAQLIKDLRERGVSKLTSTPPSGEGNQVDDLKLYGDQATGFTLEWTYKNLGDLNLDGLVSASDLTPVGQHFDETCDGDNWPTACRADGNNDGAVTISDITSIGQNYLTHCAGYNVYGCDSAAGPWVMYGGASPPPTPVPGIKVFNYSVPGGSHWYYQVRPFNADGVEGIPSLVSSPTLLPPRVMLGNDDISISAVIDPAGTELEADLGSPDQHVKFTFPPGAVLEPLSIGIGTNDGSYTPYSGELKSPIVALGLSDEVSLKEPVTIEVKFDRNDLTKVIVPFIVDSEGQTHLIDLLEMKSPEFTAVFETWHLKGHLLWLVQDTVAAQAVQPGGMRSTGFTPKYDGFWISKGPDTWWSGNTALGMVAFANWYYCAGKTWSEGNFYPRFRTSTGPPNHHYCQEIISVRANTAIIKEWPSYWYNYVEPLLDLNDAQRFAAVVNGLANTGHPVLMRLYHGYSGYYSVLATGYDNEGIYIYDPYKPYYEYYIHLDPVTKEFDPYEGRTQVYYCGPGALWVNEPYQNILDDAKQEFGDSKYAVVQVTSHGTGQMVSPGDLIIAGHVESPFLLVEKLLVMVGGEFTWVAVPPDGNFSANLPIVPGWNYFSFEAYSSTYDNEEVELFTTLDIDEFRLYGVELP